MTSAAPASVDRDLGRTTWPEVPAGSLVLVPVGSTEQHGPHLPVSTDTVIAVAVADGVAAALPAPVLVTPPIAFAASGEHAGFPGTVSIGAEVLQAVLVETIRSLSLWAARIVLVNGHGGNVPTVSRVVAQMRSEGHAVSWVPCAVPGGDAHAGRTETSLLLHLDPSAVRLDEATAGDVRPIEQLLPQLVAAGVRAVSPSGVLGDPAGATPAEGRELLAAMIAGAVDALGAGAAR
ncbi:mycofactocin biosynthesis peptidyl-dipeptidase MftE [uncultured Amnibacterium sp.]|uniref:mycofactocin biosynthesis peptidyl-dipeptidase MftE n=1 Tax=uncultured Amnibacterium sp. TaxID=1631851 RepID=UPI0035CB0A87